MPTNDVGAPVADPMTKFVPVLRTGNKDVQMRMQTNDRASLVSEHKSDRIGSSDQPVTQAFGESGERRLHGIVPCNSEQRSADRD
jgi:hypothetical protein